MLYNGGVEFTLPKGGMMVTDKTGGVLKYIVMLLLDWVLLDNA